MFRLFRGFAIATLLLYGVGTWRGWTLFGASRSGMKIPADVRQSAGGYRSYHFWGGGK